MYKIVFENNQETLLTHYFDNPTQLFEASLKLDEACLDEIEATRATSYLNGEILLLTTNTALILEFNINVIKNNTELLNLILSNRSFNNIRDWLVTPTSEELTQYAIEKNTTKFFIGCWVSYTTKYGTITTEHDFAPLKLYFSTAYPKCIIGEYAFGLTEVAFQLEDFIEAEIACSYSGQHIWLVDYKDLLNAN